MESAQQQQLWCAVAWGYTMSRILKAHAMQTGVAIDHTISSDDMYRLAEEFLSHESSVMGREQIREYYLHVSKAEGNLKLTKGEHDEKTLNHIRYLHDRYFVFQEYPYLRGFILRHIGEALRR